MQVWRSHSCTATTRQLFSSYSAYRSCRYRKRRIVTVEGGEAAWKRRRHLHDTPRGDLHRSFSSPTAPAAKTTLPPGHSEEEDQQHASSFPQTLSSSHVCFSSSSSSNQSKTTSLTPLDWMESAKETRFADDENVWGPLTILATMTSTHASTPLLWNLRRLGQATMSTDVDGDTMDDLGHASRLSSILFFQVLTRESPPVLCRNSSLPASYLTTPQIMGSLFGLSLRRFVRSKQKKEENDPLLDKEYLLEHHGIQSNRMMMTSTCNRHGNATMQCWTGISMARWMQLLPKVANEDDHDRRLLLFPVWTCTVWLLALQQIAHSPTCLSAFWVATDRAMLGSSNSSGSGGEGEFALSSHSTRQEEEDVSSLSFLRQSTMSWLQEECRSDNNNHGGNLFHKMPPAVSNGYYAPTVTPSLRGATSDDRDDTPPILRVADCMEAVVREVLNLLVWNQQTGSLDLARLPSTALPELHRLYSNDDHDGQAWFDLLSDIHDCDYFEQMILSSETGNYYQYELAPTVDNLVHALQHVLVGRGTSNHHQEEDTHHTDVTRSKKWSTLQDVTDFLAEEHRQQQSRTGEENTTVPSPSSNMEPLLLFHHDILTHDTGSGDGGSDETAIPFQHDFLTLRMNGSPHAIEIRLRCDWQDKSGMAVVTHMYDNKYNDASKTKKTGSQIQGVKKDRVLQLLDQAWEKMRSEHTAASSSHPQNEEKAGRLFFLNALPRALNVAPGSGRRHHSYPGLDEVDDDDDMSAICKLLIQEYGPDRRRIAIPAETRDNLLEQQRASHEALANAIRLSCRLIQRHNSRNKKGEDVGMALLCWLLTETPVVVESSSSHSMIKDSAWLFQQRRKVEKALLELPFHCRQQKRLQDSLSSHRWLVAGPMVSMMLQWENYQVTMGDVVRGLGLIDSLQFLLQKYFSFWKA